MSGQITFKQGIITLLISVILFSVGLFVWLFLFPTLNKIEAAEAEILRLEQLADEATARRLSYNKLLSEIETAKAEVDSLSDEVPVGFNTTMVTYFVQKELGPYASAISINMTGKPSEGEETLIMPIAIEYVVPLSDFFNALQALEDQEYITRLTTLSYSVMKDSQEESEKNPEINVTVVLDYLVQMPEGYMNEAQIRDRAKGERGGN